jgi:hypothetical protein
MSKFFTVMEANDLLPQLRSILMKTREKRQKLIHLSTFLSGAKEGHLFDYGSPAGPAYILVLDAFYRLTGEIESLGVLVKDYEQGLCDFPHLREGRIVYLCWKSDEDQISWWHDVDAGFAGRQPL